MDSSLEVDRTGSCVIALGFNIIFLLFCMHEGEDTQESECK